jgi:hypothetical protein
MVGFSITQQQRQQASSSTTWFRRKAIDARRDRDIFGGPLRIATLMQATCHASAGNRTSRVPVTLPSRH